MKQDLGPLTPSITGTNVHPFHFKHPSVLGLAFWQLLHTWVPFIGQTDYRVWPFKGSVSLNSLEMLSGQIRDPQGLALSASIVHSSAQIAWQLLFHTVRKKVEEYLNMTQLASGERRRVGHAPNPSSRLSFQRAHASEMTKGEGCVLIWGDLRRSTMDSWIIIWSLIVLVTEGD